MSGPIMSQDGKWMWTGAEWIPAPPTHNPMGLHPHVQQMAQEFMILHNAGLIQPQHQQPVPQAKKPSLASRIVKGTVAVAIGATTHVNSSTEQYLCNRCKTIRTVKAYSGIPQRCCGYPMQKS